MKTICKTILASLAIGVLALMPTQALAQSPPQPAVVISIAKIQEQLDDAKYLVDAAGFGQMAFLINVQADQFLKGVDNTKAAGVLLYFEEGNSQPNALGFLPIENLDDVLNTISNNMGEVDEGDDMTTIITDNESEIHLKQVGDYAFLSDKKEMFENIPESPAKLLGDMPSKYNIAAQVFGQRIPASLRQQWVGLIRDGYESQLDQMGDDLAADLQQGNLDFQMEQLESMINETDELMIGFAADKDSKSMYFDIEMVGLADSVFAKRCQATADAKPSEFLGFVEEGCAFNANACYTMLAEDAEAYKKMLDTLQDQGMEELEADGDLSDEDLENLESAMKEMIEIVKQTLDEGILDTGMIAQMDKGEINFASGMRIADPQRLESLVKKYIPMLQDELGDKVQINLNSGSHLGATMHTIVFTVPEEEEEVIDSVGEEVTVILGIGDKSVYVAAGSSPQTLLKDSMARSKTASTIQQYMQYNVYLAPIMKFVSGFENNEMVEIMAEKLTEAGNDRIAMTSSLKENGMKMRLDVQDGVLKLIQAAQESMGQGFGPDEDDF